MPQNRSLVRSLSWVASLIWIVPGNSLMAEPPRQLVAPRTLPPTTRLALRLHGGDYEVRSASDGRLHVSETRDAARSSEARTSVDLREDGGTAHLEIDPPTGRNGAHIVIEMPPCAGLDLEMTAGELVFATVPCERTKVSLHAGEVRASLGDGERYRTVKASVSIGEVDAPGLAPAEADVNKGGFFQAFAREGRGSRSFLVHVGTGQITLEGTRQ